MNLRPVTIAVVVLAVIAVAGALYVLSSILVPFVLAGLLAILFRPLVALLRRWRIPMPLCLLVVLAISVGALWGVVGITTAGVTSVIERAPEYQVRLDALTSEVSGLLRRASVSITGKSSSFSWNTIFSVSAITSAASAAVGGVLSFVGDAALMLLFMMFMVVSGEHFPAKLRNATLGIQGFDASALYATVNKHVLKYLRIKTLINLATALLSWIILELFGVDFAPLLGLLTFFLHYIPNVGSIVSSVLPAFIFLVQTGSFTEVLVMSIVLSGVQTVIGNIVEPKIMGNSLDLSPVLVLFSLAFWGFMWGFVGMIISVPIMAIVKTLLEAFEGTRPLGLLMAGKVLPPVVPTIQDKDVL